MREAQIYIKNRKNPEQITLMGGVVSQLGGGVIPLVGRGYQNITVPVQAQEKRLEEN